MSKVLNDAQRKLVENNHNLIYSFLNSRHLSLDSVEDWYGAAAIGLCKAAMVYDESRGTRFTTLAYICMDNEVRGTMRTERKLVQPCVSLDEPIEETESLTVADVLTDYKQDFTESVYLNDAINIAYKKLNNRDKAIIDMIVAKGMTNVAVAAKFGVAQPTVSRVYTKFVKMIKAYFND